MKKMYDIQSFKYFTVGLDSAFRIPESEAALPRIPVQPIGYDEAEVFLK